jgi:hypothetical protein
MAHRGRSLKTLRETKLIQLRRISNETRISIAYLEDLEEERFDRFPGKFYFRSFARAYAASIGLDPEEVAHDLLIAFEEWSGERTSAPLFRPDRPAEDGILNRIAGFLGRIEEV